MYGITETTVHATFHRITEADLDSPRSRIGLPLPGFAHVVVDEAGHPVPCGADGELLLSGPQVTAGYLHRPELDEQRFVWLESDGVRRRWYHSGDLVYEDASGLVYLGRKDSQVKLRGHRIELGDVETAVRSHDAVADAVVGVHDFRSAGDMRLVCSYTTASGRPLLDGALREHVAALLPTYMCPARYAHLSAIPRTRNGKVDRQSVATRWEAQQR
jgi:acyl-coenzyme A synthetase/AMP-(fatty) acid ligase